MSRVLLAAFGSLGDLHPYIAVGKALQAQGRIARVAAAEDYRSIVEQEGLEFAPVRPSMADLGQQDELARLLFHPLRGTEYLVRDVLMPHQRSAYEDVTAAAQDTDLLVSHPITYVVQMVAQRAGKPWLSSVLAPMSMVSRHDPPALPGPDLLRVAARLGPWAYRITSGLVHRAVYGWEAPLRALRAELGFPPTTAVMTMEGQFSPQGNLALFDAPLMQPQPDWPASTTVCGAALYDGKAANATELVRLQQFLDAGPAPIVFALGSSVVWMAQDYWQHAIDAATSLGQRAILLTGKASLPVLPDTVQAFEYLPYSCVFPHASVVVHQAGIGTLSQALRSGRPQVITPVSFDQPDNAMRAARLGVARVLPFRKVNAQRLRKELSQALVDDAQHAAARAIATGLRATDGAAAAARLIIRVLADTTRS